MSLGQFMQWVGTRDCRAPGTVQVWPGTPVAAALLEDDGVSAAFGSAIRAATKPGPMRLLPGWTFARPDGRGRWAGGRRRTAARRGVRAAGRPSSARMGAWDEDGGRSARRTRPSNPARCSTRSATPSPRSSASFTCTPEMSPPPGSSSRRGSAPPCGPLTATFSTLFSPVSLAISEGRPPAFLGREELAGIRPPRRADPLRRRLRAHRRRLRQHQRPHRLGRRRGVDHRHTTRGSRHRIAQSGRRSRARISRGRTSPAAARAGSSRKAASPKRPATVSTVAW